MLDDLILSREHAFRYHNESFLLRVDADLILRMSAPPGTIEIFDTEKPRSSNSYEGISCKGCQAIEQPIVPNASRALSGQFYVTSMLAYLLAPYLDKSSMRVLKSTSRAWSSVLRIAESPAITASSRIPVEVLHQIYSFLGPKDFNSARHSCRKWMRASLDTHLLQEMLCRGGWLDSALYHASQRFTYHQPIMNSRSDEWMLSRHLSRQCALSSGWTGNGVDIGPALTESFTIDFSPMTNGENGLVFTTSACGHFLCVARAALIFIYDIRNGFLKPVTRVMCPRQVLSMTLDVSSSAPTLAALLQGRTGMVYELNYDFNGICKDLNVVHDQIEEYPYQAGTKSSNVTPDGADPRTGQPTVQSIPPRVGRHYHQHTQD